MPPWCTTIWAKPVWRLEWLQKALAAGYSGAIVEIRPASIISETTPSFSNS